ncbi:hypothetical protein GJ744_011335 [Endocarpon pusillum]|uniref:Uncharacterized protein n=1 Tax=Endocarpon pusillum TaxID=364733 RepID=A0A8H7E7A4_9EURO|nr:hypothetical protein GJ744_011335 [Endocarpon pusillum]
MLCGRKPWSGGGCASLPKFSQAKRFPGPVQYPSLGTPVYGKLTVETRKLQRKRKWQSLKQIWGALKEIQNGASSENPGWFASILNILRRLVYGTNGPGEKNNINRAIGSIHLSTSIKWKSFGGANVTPDTMVVTWLRNRTDLAFLSDFLEADGHTDIMPLDQKSFLPLAYYDRHLHASSNGKKLPLKLDIMFPLLFPRHALSGRNHRALVDAEQLRLGTMKLEEFCFGQRYLQQNRSA